jgi:hypothetical protein
LVEIGAPIPSDGEFLEASSPPLGLALLDSRVAGIFLGGIERYGDKDIRFLTIPFPGVHSNLPKLLMEPFLPGGEGGLDSAFAQGRIMFEYFGKFRNSKSPQLAPGLTKHIRN